MPPPSLTITINSLVALLQQRLAETTGVFWTQIELTLYIRQAIREFQVLTGFWRSRIQLATVANTTYYDLSAADAQLAYTVTDDDILKQISFQLLESGVLPYIATTQFVLTALTDALDQKREEMLGNSRMVVSDYAPAVPGGGDGRVVLPNGMLQIHRADWQDSISSLWSRLDRTDEIGAYGWLYNWPNDPKTPTGFSVAVNPPFGVQLVKPPANNGVLDMILTQSNPYTYTGSPQLLNIPDDSTFALAWGILASVLGQDSQSRDFERAGYALRRFNAAVDLLKTYPLVLQVAIGNNQIQPATIEGLDAWRPGWRNETTAQPDTIAIAARNMVATAPIADAVYNATMDCIVNSPASGSVSATIVIPSDIVTALLDNAVHLATFKMGGPEWQATMQNYQNFIDTAQQYALRQRAEQINWRQLRDVTNFEVAQQPFQEIEAEIA